MAPAGERDGGGPQVGLARLSRLLSPRQREAPPSGAGRRRSVSWSVVGVLAALVVVSGVVHVWALHRDLPLHDADESAFVGPAVHVAATGDLNPHWFGHPGSTVIYPLAALFHARHALGHPGEILSSDPALTHELRSNPTEFYVIGRLWSIALAIGALPLLFVLGRRGFSTRVALIAAAIWAVLPFPVFHAQIVRTDSAGVFFGLLALWLCVRLLDEPSRRWCVLAGLSVGLAVASRYFMVALAPGLVMAAVLPHRHALWAAARSAAIALISAVVGFALATPYFFLDWHTAERTLRAENASGYGSPGGLSHLGNLRWYLGTGIPRSFTWPLWVLAAVGVVLVLRRPRASQVLLLVFCTVFLLGLSVSKLHQQQWVIQILPVLTLFAAFAVVAVTDAFAAPLSRAVRRPILTPIALTAVTVILALDPLIRLARADADPSTGGAARDWIVAHLPPGSRIIEDSVNVPLHDSRFHVAYRLDAPTHDPTRYAKLGPDQYLRLDPHTHTVAFHQEAGYQYLVGNGYWIAFPPYPREAAFYRDLTCRTKVVADFRPTDKRHGWPIVIYGLTQQPSRPHGPSASICGG